MLILVLVVSFCAIDRVNSWNEGHVGHPERKIGIERLHHYDYVPKHPSDTKNVTAMEPMEPHGNKSIVIGVSYYGILLMIILVWNE